MKIQYKMVNNEIVNLLFELIQLEINVDYCKIIADIYQSIYQINEFKTSNEKLIINKWIEKDEFGEVLYYKNDKDEVMANFIDFDLFNNEMSEFLENGVDINYEPLVFKNLGIEKYKPINLIKLGFLFK